METSSQQLLKGSLVRVRSKDAIMATADEKGMTDGLPVMQEMFQYCGGLHRIRKCVNRIFIEGTGIYEHKGSFILEGVACNGASHRDCQRSCNILWKKEWLESPDLPAVNQAQPQKIPPSCSTSLCQGQASVFLNSSKRLSFWDYRQYYDDYRSKTSTISYIVAMLYQTFFRRIFSGFIKYFRSLYSLKTKKQVSQTQTIASGDLVEILTRAEIKNTLNKNNRLNGLLFSEVMWKYCGKRFRVLKKLEHMITEQTGEFKNLTETYLLHNNICDGLAFRGCPRECYWLWKKSWFKKIAV